MIIFTSKGGPYANYWICNSHDKIIGEIVFNPFYIEYIYNYIYFSVKKIFKIKCQDTTQRIKNLIFLNLQNLIVLIVLYKIRISITNSNLD